MSLSGPRLSACDHEDLKNRAVYGMGVPMQVSQTQVAIIANLRLCGVPAIDMEAGSDAIVFDSLAQLRAERAVPLDRSERARDPRTGSEIVLVKYPMTGGFVPLGARLADGRPHPHAGTGFGLGQTLGFPADHSVKQPANLPDILRYFDLVQLRLVDGRLVIESTTRLAPDQIVPGWSVSNRPINQGVQDGEDLLTGFVAAPEGGLVHGAGVCRWSRGHDGWRPVQYTPVTPLDTSFEPSLIRDRDGALLLSVRGFGIEGVPREEVAKLDESLKGCFRVFRSVDGKQWTEHLKVDRIRPWSPVVMGQTVGGGVFLAANERAEPWPAVRGNTLPDARMREKLALWPLSDDRRSVGTPTRVVDAVALWGRAPSALTWYLDHPISAVVRLADGKPRTLLCFRVCDSAEVVSDAPPTKQTGLWVEEVDWKA